MDLNVIDQGQCFQELCEIQIICFVIIVEVDLSQWEDTSAEKEEVGNYTGNIQVKKKSCTYSIQILREIMIVSVQLCNVSFKGSNVLDTNTIISSNFENVTY